ncbi:hypothetical protein GCM10009638_16970 [Luteococcus sanguinis]
MAVAARAGGDGLGGVDGFDLDHGASWVAWRVCEGSAAPRLLDNVARNWIAHNQIVPDVMLGV